MYNDIHKKVIIRPREAADYLRDIGISISVEKLCLGLQQKVFPFGDYIGANGHGVDVYIIYTKMLLRWAAARSTFAAKQLAELDT